MRRFLPLLLILLLASCNEEAFDVSSLSLRGSVSIVMEDESERTETLTLSAAFSDPDESYSYRLEAPGGILVWEGGMSGSDIQSDTIEITQGASFPSGEYSVLFYSTNGTELSTSITYSSDRTYSSFSEDGILSDSSYVTEYDEDGSIIAEGERESGYAISPDAARAELELTDRYGSRISVSQSFPPEV